MALSGQNISFALRHSSQCPHESWRNPQPARSPLLRRDDQLHDDASKKRVYALNAVTCDPTCCTMPTPSWPRTMSDVWWCWSVPHRPAWVILSRTSSGLMVSLWVVDLIILPEGEPLKTVRSIPVIVVVARGEMGARRRPDLLYQWEASPTWDGRFVIRNL